LGSDIVVVVVVVVVACNRLKVRRDEAVLRMVHLCNSVAHSDIPVAHLGTPVAVVGILVAAAVVVAAVARYEVHASVHRASEEFQ
jgi:hypothetical protein